MPHRCRTCRTGAAITGLIRPGRVQSLPTWSVIRFTLEHADGLLEAGDVFAEPGAFALPGRKFILAEHEHAVWPGLHVGDGGVALAHGLHAVLAFQRVDEPRHGPGAVATARTPHAVEVVDVGAERGPRL